MSGVIDTNLLLFAVNRNAPEHRRARELLTAAAGSGARWFLTEGIIYEFLRVATHHKVFARPLPWRDAMAFLQPFLAHPDFSVLSAGPNHWQLLSEILAATSRPSGNLFFDIRTVVLMREHGVRRIYTADTDFLQFKGIEVVNPLGEIGAGG